MTILRKLNHSEASFTISNLSDPLCVVIVIKLDNIPSNQKVLKAVSLLQRKHILLSAGIIKKKSDFYFKLMDPVREISVKYFERKGDEEWHVYAEKYLNTTFDHTGPLMKCVVVSEKIDPNGIGEILLVFHHSIIDAVSAREILNDFLTLSCTEKLAEVPEVAFSSVNLPLNGGEFPPSYRGLRLFRKVIPFIFKQVVKEVAKGRRGMKIQKPASSHNKISYLKIPRQVSRKAMVNIQRKGETMNSFLNAAILIAVQKVKHKNQPPGILQTISFANLRPFWKPELKQTDFGCFTSMIILSVHSHSYEKPIELSSDIRKGITKGGLTGDVFLFSYTGRKLIRTVNKDKNRRLGSSALSYIDILKIDQSYGKHLVKDIHAFITNNKTGPQLAGFGKILFGCIELDFMYLDSETSSQEAEAIVENVREMIYEIAGQED